MIILGQNEKDAYLKFESLYQYYWRLEILAAAIDEKWIRKDMDGAISALEIEVAKRKPYE